MNLKSKNESILYTCIYCGDESEYSIPKLIVHLDINHENITEIDKNELIKDLKQAISKQHKNQEKELVQEKIRQQKRLKAANQAKNLSKFKNDVLKALKDSGIDKKMLGIISSGKNIEKVKRILMFGIKKEFQIYLDDFGIDYYITSKRKKRKKLRKDYFDKTKNSIRTIYTPMGNKK
ncbi:MAG: hypothetical protein ACON4X_09390 [Polaribacter sp.]